MRLRKLISTVLLLYIADLDAKPATVLNFDAKKNIKDYSRVILRVVLEEPLKLTGEKISNSPDVEISGLGKIDNIYSRRLRFKKSHFELILYKEGSDRPTVFIAPNDMVVDYQQTIESPLPNLDTFAHHKAIRFVVSVDRSERAVFRFADSDHTFEMFDFALFQTNDLFNLLNGEDEILVFSPQQRKAYAPAIPKEKCPVHENHVKFDKNLKNYFQLKNRKRVSNRLDLSIIRLPFESDPKLLSSVGENGTDLSYTDFFNKAVMDKDFFGKIYRSLNYLAADAFGVSTLSPADLMPPPEEAADSSVGMD